MKKKQLRLPRRPVIAFTTLCALLVSAPQLRAEEPSSTEAAQGPPEVIVTATKQSQELSRVPISISAYTQEMLDERHIRGIDDVVSQTPGLDLGDQGSNGVGDRISVRGIDSNSGPRRRACT